MRLILKKRFCVHKIPSCPEDEVHQPVEYGLLEELHPVPVGLRFKACRRNHTHSCLLAHVGITHRHSWFLFLPSNRLSLPFFSRHWMFRGMKRWALRGSPYREDVRAKGTSSTGTNRKPQDAAFLCQPWTWRWWRLPVSATDQNTRCVCVVSPLISEQPLDLRTFKPVRFHQSGPSAQCLLVSRSGDHY